jgi:hypothetical protein
MDPRQEDLRATAEAIAADADRLRVIEEEKASISIEDPRMIQLSDEAAAIARALLPKTVAQSELSEEAAES